MGLDAGPDARKLLSELVTHLNALEQRMAELADGVEELKDLELVNKLDIINLSAHAERERLSAPATPEAGNQLEQALAGLEAELAELREQGAGGLGERVELLSKRIELLEGARRPAAPVAAAPGPSCNQCGTPLRAGIKFCGSCGATVAPPHLLYLERSTAAVKPGRAKRKQKRGKR